MPKSPKSFKRPPKKYQPRGLSILYEDHDLLVVDKAKGILAMSNDKVRDRTAYYLLTNYVRKGNPKSRHRLFIVHRLDKDTSGVLVFAKSGDAKRFLQDKWQDFQKQYVAVVHGSMPEKEGIITSFLAENSARKMYSVTDRRKGKFAKTGYRVLKESSGYSLLEIDLYTGRKHQIRVHLADTGCPVAGDKRYGASKRTCRRLMLHAASLTIAHPHTKEAMTFTAPIPKGLESLLK